MAELSICGVSSNCCLFIVYFAPVVFVLFLSVVVLCALLHLNRVVAVCVLSYSSFLKVPWACLQSVIMVFPGLTHLLAHLSHRFNVR